MEILVGMGELERKIFFKSHHSGMEIWGQASADYGGEPLNRTIVGWKFTGFYWTFYANRVFKSHHSGMEMVAGGRRVARNDRALNRTIVGWKFLFPKNKEG